jgi:hypothetical protein
MSFRDERRYTETEAYFRSVPDDFKPESVQQQIERFFQNGGKITEVPAGKQSAPASLSMHEQSELTAAKTLGAKDG